MIKLSYNVSKYRRDILDLANPDDCIIELGCHIGKTTELLPKTCNIIAVDNSPEASKEMKKLEHVSFINGDVRLHEVLADVFKITQSCDILAIDLGGGYHPDTVFKVFYIWSSTFKPTHTRGRITPPPCFELAYETVIQENEKAYPELREKADAMCASPYAAVSAWFMKQFPQFRSNPLFYLDNKPKVIPISTVLEMAKAKKSSSVDAAEGKMKKDA